MKGIIIKRFVYKDGYGLIRGEDGKDYRFHVHNVFGHRNNHAEGTDTTKLLEGMIVRFEPRQDTVHHVDAKNIRKTGYGTRHPFIWYLKQLRRTVDRFVPEDFHKQVIIDDIDTMILYFSVVEDLEEFPDPVGTFRKSHKKPQNASEVD